MPKFQLINKQNKELLAELEADTWDAAIEQYRATEVPDDPTFHPEQIDAVEVD